MPLLVTSASGVNGDGYGALAFDRNGAPLGVFSRDERIADPRGLVVHQQDDLLYLNSGKDRILALDADGTVVRDTGPIAGLPHIANRRKMRSCTRVKTVHHWAALATNRFAASTVADGNRSKKTTQHWARAHSTPFSLQPFRRSARMCGKQFSTIRIAIPQCRKWFAQRPRRFCPGFHAPQSENFGLRQLSYSDPANRR
jgi:hypothetical protein